MTDDEGPTREEIIEAVEQALGEFAPDADLQDIREFTEGLRDCDWEELEVNIGAGFGQLCEGQEACDAAFARYAELIGAEKVVHNPSPRPGVEGP